MREIKFRVWHADNNEMLGPFDLTQNPIYWADKMRDGVLMQYTGLQDADVREIYEGDVTAVEIINGVKLNVPISFEGGSFNISEIPRGYGFRSTSYPLGELLESGYKIEVIGNIYENKELLEG